MKEKITIYNDDEKFPILPEEFEVDIDSEQTTVIDYKDPDAKPNKTCYEIYIADKSGNTMQLFQAKRGDKSPCLIISQFQEIDKIGEMKLSPDARTSELRLKSGWQVKFLRGYAVTKHDIQNIKLIEQEMRDNTSAILEIKEDGYKERIDEIKKNCEEKVKLAQEQRNDYRTALYNLSRESAEAETVTMTNVIQMVAKQARTQRGKTQMGTRVFATKAQTESSQSDTANKEQGHQKSAENSATVSE